MAFDLQTTYNKFQTSCECQGECSCSKKDDCGCCPVGTVGITDDCGKNIGCLSPNDASEYKIRKHIPATGYVKLIHPVTGIYLGDVTPQQAIDFMAAIDPAITPEPPIGEYNPNLSSSAIAMTAPGVGLTDSEALGFSVDRISCDQGVVIQFSGAVPAGVSFLAGATSLLIPEGSSVITDGILIDDQVNAGVIVLTIAFSSCSQTITRTLTITVS